MKFKSKKEAYSYVLLFLYSISDSYHDKEKLDSCIIEIKKAFDDHLKNVQIVLSVLDRIDQQGFDSDTQRVFATLKTTLSQSEYSQTLEEKFNNPLARRAESELAILLLQQPTQRMMEAVDRVSKEILKVLNDPVTAKNNVIKNFIKNTHEHSHVIALGSFKQGASLAAIIEMLEKNNSWQLAEILHLHFKFALDAFRELPIKHAPQRLPSGKLAEIIKEHWHGEPQDFFKDAISQQGTVGYAYRSLIDKKIFYQSGLYRMERNRGRQAELKQKSSHVLGLMLEDQAIYEIDLPHHTSLWVPDCKGQAANLKSQYVLDSIENEAVYVAGPSGMTSLLLGQMEILANFEDIKLKQNYLSAVLSYIVAGGFHSIHEVIGPAQYALDLVPGYAISAPRAGELARPPNYSVFFAQQIGIDPEFKNRYQQAWKNYLSFFHQVYAPKNTEILLSQVVVSKESEANYLELRDKVLSRIDKFLREELNKANVPAKRDLTFFKQDFLAIYVKVIIEFVVRVKSAKDNNELLMQIETIKGVQKGFVDKGVGGIRVLFENCLQEIDSILLDKENKPSDTLTFKI